MYTERLEASVTHSILTQLSDLGWVVDEKDPKNNVTQQRPKTQAEKEIQTLGFGVKVRDK